MKRHVKNLSIFLVMLTVLLFAPALVSQASTFEVKEGTSKAGAATVNVDGNTYYFTRGLSDRSAVSWFKFTTPNVSDGYLTLTYKNNDSDSYSEFAIVAASGSTVASDSYIYENRSSTCEEYVSVNGRYGAAMEPNTTYYIQVTGIYQSKHAQFTLSYVEDRNPNNAASAETVALNQTYTRSIDSNSWTDEDYFLFQARRTGEHRFTITNISVDDGLDYAITRKDTGEIIKSTKGNSVSDNYLYDNRTDKWDVELEAGTWYCLKVSENTKGNYSFSVTDARVSGISLSTGSKTVTAGKDFQLTAAVSPSNAYNQTLSWSSSNTDIATVDKNGKVTTKNAGTAIITAAATDGSNVTASCKVYVKPKKVGTISVEENNATSIKISWRTNGTVDGYRIGVYDKSAKGFKIVKTVKTNYATVTGLKSCKEYKICVQPYVKDGNLRGSYKSIMTTTTPAKSKITKVTKTKTEVSWSTTYITKKITWKKVKNASGYRLLYSRSKNGTYYSWAYATSTMSGTSCQVRSARWNTYFFKIQTYRKYKNRIYYGAASPAVKVSFT